MPTIPSIRSRIDASSVGTPSRVPASPGGLRLDTSGTRNVAAALGGLSNAADDIARTFAAIEDDKLRVSAANRLALFDFSQDEQALAQNAPTDVQDYVETSRSLYMQRVAEYTDGIENLREREFVRTRLMADLPKVTDRAVRTQTAIGNANAVAQTNESLGFLYNSARSNPADFDALFEKGALVIETQPQFGPVQKQAARTEFGQQLAKRAWEGMVAGATTPGELDALQKRLTTDVDGRDWRREFKPEDYDRTLDSIAERRRSIASHNDTSARATLTDLESRSNKYTLLPQDELASAVRQAKDSGNPALLSKAARIARDQDLLRTYGRATPAQLRAKADTLTGAGAAYPGLPQPVSDAINEAAAATGISAAYLGATTMREYRGVYAKPFSDGSIDYGRKSDTSTATGIYQFVERTWLGIMKDGRTARRFGLEVEGKDDAALLEMRKDPRASTLLAAVLAEQNKAYLERDLQRPVDDSELYLAHFAGAGGASALIRAAVENPNGAAEATLPDAAKANRGLFYTRDGAPLTNREVYANITGGFSTEVGKVGFGDQEFLRGMAADAERQLKADPMTYARNAGTFAVPQIDPNAPADPEAYKALGRAASGVAQYYSVPRDDFKPLPEELAGGLQRRLESATADEAIGILRAMNAMGPDMAPAALRQLGTKNKSLAVFAYAGGVPDLSVGADIVRGQKRLADDAPDQAKLGTTFDAISKDFLTVTGEALRDLSPAVTSAIQDAALAHYVASGYTGRWSRSTYADSVAAVLGGKDVLGSVNGRMTIAPAGTKADDMETALENMTAGDWTNYSPQKTPPRYGDGTEVDPRVLANEAQLVPIGAGRYKVRVSNGTLVAAPGVPYVVEFNADRVGELLSRNSARIPSVSDMPWQGP